SGMFIVAEGNEGAGKSFFVAEVKAWAKRENKRLFSLMDFCAREHRFPTPDELQGYDALLSQEPSPTWVGEAIREEMVKKSDRVYTGRQMGEAWSIDRLILYRRVIHPALQMGLTVFSDRSVASSVVYQPIREPDPMPLEELLSLEGQRLAFETKIDAMAIYLVDPEESLRRLEAREKKDNAVFDHHAFITHVDERYRSDWFRKLFEDRGTKIELIDTTHTTLKQTQQLTRAFLNRALS
ncbi:MAG: Thymidylate kinase, partial [Candidatus Giovannonibacteria bacterium GW2011_GWA2_53_7]